MPGLNPRAIGRDPVPEGMSCKTIAWARRRWILHWLHRVAVVVLARVYFEQFALIVDDYDEAIRFFVDVLGFELVEDSPSVTNDGRPKRWVVVRPPGASTALLLARADGEAQGDAVGAQFAGRVGLFLRVDDFQSTFERMRTAGVEFVTEPRQEPYGQVAVFMDVAGNRWDLLGPRPSR